MDVKQMIGSVIEIVIKAVAVIFLIMFVYDAALKAYDYGYRIFAEEPLTVGEGRTISISVDQDESVRDIGKKLQERGLIRDANLFILQELVSEHHGQIQPGIYDLNTSMTGEEMLTVMSADPKGTEEESDIYSGDMDDMSGISDDMPEDDSGEISDDMPEDESNEAGE